MVATAIEKLHAQGDLMLQDMPDQQFLTKATHTNYLPIADKECVDILECEYHLFSDSVLKLGKKQPAHKWAGYYKEAITWLHKSDLRLRTVHGKPFKYHWDVEAGITTAGILRKVKKLIEDKAEGDPSRFTDRVVIFGCLNDFNDLPAMSKRRRSAT